VDGIAAEGSTSGQGRGGGLEAVGPSRPIGFPACRLCPLRGMDRPDVCLACLRASRGQGLEAGAEARCAVCGQARPDGAACPTAWCARRDRSWSVAFSVGVYATGMRRAVLRYKYGGERWWAGVFGRLLAGYLDANAPWFEDFELIVATPSYAGPGARRSWDPVGSMAAEVARLTGAAWSVAPGAVVKRAETSPMSARGRAERTAGAARELRAALVVPDPDAVRDRRILVLDDVLAEGSTLREMARVLRRAGAREVAGLVLSRVPWAGVAPRRHGTRPPRSGRPG
jgi:predicted amidophosphoribosyltransferase